MRPKNNAQKSNKNNRKFPPPKETRLKQNLRKILSNEDLRAHKELIEQLSTELEVNIRDCAAALSFMLQPDLNNLFQTKNNPFSQQNNKNELEVVILKKKYVRYRLNVGKKNNVSLIELKNVLVEVSGVERKSIGKLDIRNYFTLIDLPEGMPADIFQLIAETEIQNQKLNIKRVNFQNRFNRRKNKNSSSQS